MDAFSNQTVFAVCAAWLISAFVLAKIFGKYTAGTPTLLFFLFSLSFFFFSLFRFSFLVRETQVHLGALVSHPATSSLFSLLSSLFSLSIDLPRGAGQEKEKHIC